MVSPINMSKHNIRLPPALLVHWCRRKGGESGKNGLQQGGRMNVDFVVTISEGFLKNVVTKKINIEFVKRKEKYCIKSILISFGIPSIPSIPPSPATPPTWPYFL